MNVESQAKIAISGTIVYKDKDGNIIKEVPFSSKPLPVEQVPEEEVKDGNVCE